jgi:hypothetical protein
MAISLMQKISSVLQNLVLILPGFWGGIIQSWEDRSSSSLPRLSSIYINNCTREQPPY